MSFAFFPITLSVFRAEGCSIKILLLTITKRVIVKLDGITATHLQNDFPQLCWTLKARFCSVHDGTVSLKLSEAHHPMSRVATAALKADDKSSDTKQELCLTCIWHFSYQQLQRLGAPAPQTDSTSGTAICVNNASWATRRIWLLPQATKEHPCFLFSCSGFLNAKI